MELTFLNVAVSGRASANSVKVNGDLVIFSKQLAADLGLRDDVQFAMNAEKNRLYLLHGKSGAQAYKLNGKPGNRRYLKNANIVKAVRLGSGDYPVLKDETGSFIEIDLSMPEPTFTKKPTAPRKPAAPKASPAASGKGK